MPVHVLLEPDPFVSSFKKNVDRQRSGTTVGYDYKLVDRFYHVRRPVRGIELKEDTYATLQVRNAQGVALPLFDAAAEGDSGSGPYNSNFLLQQVTEQRMEKQQVVLTFGEPYVFFFGEHPRVLSVAGVLLNTNDFNWRAEWWENYDKYLRGTACVRAKTRVYLSWDDIVVEGYVTKAVASENAQEKHTVTFQFELFLTNYQNISRVGDAMAHFYGKTVALTPDNSVPTSKLKSIYQNAVSITAKIEQGHSLLQSTWDYLNNDLGFKNISGQIVDNLEAVAGVLSNRTINFNDAEISSAASKRIQSVMQHVSASSQKLSYATGLSNKLTGLAAKLDPSLAAPPPTPPHVYFPGKGPGKPLSYNVDEFVSHPAPIPEISLESEIRYDDLSPTGKLKKVMEGYGANTSTVDLLQGKLNTGTFYAGSADLKSFFAFGGNIGSGDVKSVYRQGT